MGVGDQFLCASLVAAFSLALFIAANLFVESRASRTTVMPAAQHMRIIEQVLGPVDRREADVEHV